MPTLDPADLLSYLAQCTLIAAAATAAHVALRLHAPGVSYLYWRLVLVVALVSPLLLVETVPAPAPVTATAAVASQPAAGIGPAEAPTPQARIDWWAMAMVGMATGVLVRGGWLLAGFIRLRQRRGAGRRADGYGEELQTRLGTGAEIRLVEGLEMPVTFGVRRPVVLLPASIDEHPSEVRNAIVAHELLHVQRRDWPWHLAEEVLCALCWFNPAVWWIVSRIHLCREASIDELAVLATGRRRTYLEALIAFADHGGTATATAFSRRRHLFLRIQLLSREAVMSSTRVVLSSSVLVLALAGGSAYAAAMFPLRLDAAPEADAQTGASSNRIPKRVDFKAPDYPAAGRARGAAGTVSATVTLDAAGLVSDVRTLSVTVRTANPQISITFKGEPTQAPTGAVGDAALAGEVLQIATAFNESALAALRQWRYEPVSGPDPVKFTVSMSFKPDGEVVSALSAARPSSPATTPPPVRIGGQIVAPKKVKDVRPEYPAEARAAGISGTVILELLINADGEVEDARVLRSVPSLDEAALEAARQWRFTPTQVGGKAVPVIYTATVQFSLSSSPYILQERPVDGDVPEKNRSGLPRLIREVKPRYTPEAMRAGVEGLVVTEITIGTTGSVVDARVLRGLPMLDEQALEAVRQWQFEPTTEPVTTTVALTFSLRR